MGCSPHPEGNPLVDFERAIDAHPNKENTKLSVHPCCHSLGYDGRAHRNAPNDAGDQAIEKPLIMFRSFGP